MFIIFWLVKTLISLSKGKKPETKNLFYIIGLRTMEV